MAADACRDRQPFTLLPAIDIRDGKVVRLYQGDYARQTDYHREPLALAHEYAAAGARWLHVVDLDGARDGSLRNVALLTAMAHAGIHVQAGGGVRAVDDVKRLLDAGVTRVVVGSMAVRAPQQVLAWLQHFGPERIVLALDTRQREGLWRLPSQGWTRDEPLTLESLAPRYAEAGARHLLCTDIDRDGTLGGPNLELLACLQAIAPTLSTLVSGGVRQLDDIRAARRAGAAGIVLGRALLDGRFSLAEALAC